VLQTGRELFRYRPVRLTPQDRRSRNPLETGLQGPDTRFDPRTVPGGRKRRQVDRRC
jgi:hypothetical protein